MSISHRSSSSRGRLPEPTGFEVYRSDVRVVRDYGPQPQPEHLKDCKRGEVQMFSPKSASRLTRVARCADPALVSQFCLTYHQRNPSGTEAKKDLDSWLKALRRAVPGAGYLWILEFQTRGVPHFHVWLSVPFSVEMWQRLGAAWNRIAEPESQEHLWWHTKERWNAQTRKVERSFMNWEMNGGGYLRKYMSKEAQKCVPPAFGWVGRFWGHSRGLVPEPDFFPREDVPKPGKLTRDTSRYVEARRRRGAEVGRKIAKERGREYRPLKLRKTARGQPNSAWLNNSAGVFRRLLEHQRAEDWKRLKDLEPLELPEELQDLELPF